jgi:hypothetical protein
VSKGIPQERAQEAVATITGGRFTLLTDDKLTSGSIEEWRAELEGRVETALAEASILHPTLPTLASSNKLFPLLLSDRQVRKAVMLQHITTDQLNHLLKNNVLAVHADGTYSLAGRYVHTYFKHAHQQQPRMNDKG